MPSHRVVAVLLCLATLVPVAYTSYCGQSAIPFVLEVQHDGHPRLGCARPSCFGWTAQGRRSADTAQFYRISGEMDGFLRPDAFLQGPVLANAAGFHPQYSVCEPNYTSKQCKGSTWVGGLAPLARIDSETPMKLMCCSYNRLAGAVNTVQVELRAGQSAVGGELRDWQGRQYAFEYIADIQRLFDRNGVVYIVTLKKFACVIPSSSVYGEKRPWISPLQAAPQAPVDRSSMIPRTEKTIRGSFAAQKFDMPEGAPLEEPFSRGKPLSPLPIHQLHGGNRRVNSMKERRKVTVKDKDVESLLPLGTSRAKGKSLSEIRHAPPTAVDKRGALSRLHTGEVGSQLDPRWNEREEVRAVEALNRGEHAMAMMAMPGAQ